MPHTKAIPVGIVGGGGGGGGQEVSLGRAGAAWHRFWRASRFTAAEMKRQLHARSFIKAALMGGGSRRERLALTDKRKAELAEAAGSAVGRSESTPAPAS